MMELLTALVLILSMARWGLSQEAISNAADVTLYGAVGDGETDDSQAFLMAWGAVCGGSSSTLTIPSGKNFFLKQELNFQGPCKLSPINVQVLGDITMPSNPGTGSGLVFSNVNGLALAGNGRIDGQGSNWWQHAKKERPCVLTIKDCINIQLNGLTLSNSPRCHLRIDGSSGAAISNLQILAPESSPNTDGIDIGSSSNIQILNSIIGVGDDCIAVGGGSSFIQVNGVACGPGHGISIGSLGEDGDTDTVEEVYVKDCSFKGSTNGARIKTWQGGSGYARKIRYEGITLDAVENPIIIDQFYCNSGSGCKNRTPAVKVSDISYVGFHGTSSSDEAITFRCSESESCDGILLSDINIMLSNGGAPSRAFCSNAHGIRYGPSIPDVNCLQLLQAQPGNSPYQPTNPGSSPVQPANPGANPYTPANPGNSPVQPANPGTNPYTPANPRDNPIQQGSNPYQQIDPGTSPYQPTNPYQPGYIPYYYSSSIFVKPHAWSVQIVHLLCIGLLLSNSFSCR